MIPLDAAATDTVLAWRDGLHRTVALHHAVLFGRPGLWGDDPTQPSSVIWLRDGGDQWEAFAAGFAGPALDWLTRSATDRPIVLAAPASWTASVSARIGQNRPVETRCVQTWLRPEAISLAATTAQVRLLCPTDANAFAAIAPTWALRSWGDFATAIERGAAFGVPSRSGLASVSWIVESDAYFDKIGVATDPRFCRLGLGRAVAAALIKTIEGVRGRHPLWVVSPVNRDSLVLAQNLGFTAGLNETLLRWDP